MIPGAVVVILNGAIVASAPPAQLLFGHVMAPLAPVVTRFTAARGARRRHDHARARRAARACCASVPMRCRATALRERCRLRRSAATASRSCRWPRWRARSAVRPNTIRARASPRSTSAGDGAQLAGSVRPERAASVADGDLHALAAAGDADAAAGRFGQPAAAAHRDPRDPFTRAGD